MKPLILFDGVCNFCNGAVNWIIAHDPDAKFRFAALQSEVGQKIRAEFNIGADVDSIILIDEGHLYTHSTAALRVARLLGGIWSLGYVGVVVPRSLRDRIYKWFARNRYRWFGKQDACMIPTPDVRARFID